MNDLNFDPEDEVVTEAEVLEGEAYEAHAAEQRNSDTPLWELEVMHGSH
jgi:hypothetical protein